MQAILTKYFKDGSFLRNLSVLMSGTAIAQIVSFTLMPIVSRLFTPEDFGIFGSYTSILGVITAVISLQYTQAIMLPKHKKEALNLFFVSCFSVGSITVICLCIGIFYPSLINSLINFDSQFLVFLLPISALAFGINQTLQAWCIRIKAFKDTSQSQIIRSLSSITIWLIVGHFHGGAIGLISGSICAQFAASIKLWSVFKEDLNRIQFVFSWKKLKSMSNKYRDFPLYAAPQNLMNALSQGLPVLLLGHFYGISIAGAYAFGMKILHVPTGFMLRPLRQVLFQKASESQNKGYNLYPLFIKSTLGLMSLSLIPSMIIFIWAPQIFSLIFGSEWLQAGIYVRWLILWTFISFSNVPAVLFARILRQQKNLFLFEIIVLVSRLIVLVIGGLYWRETETIIVFSILGFFLNLFLILWIWWLLFKQKNVYTQ